MSPAVAARAADPITTEQLALVDEAGPGWFNPTAPAHFRAVARWWELEARRGYPSSRKSLLYATNMLHAADARERDGTERRWTPGVDQHTPACPVCCGPTWGPWKCSCSDGGAP